MAISEYLAVAIGAGANVDPQPNFAGSTYQQIGFTTGTAKSAQANKVWRQSSIMTAAWANVIVSLLGQNCLDDGNLANLTTQLQSAVSLISSNVMAPLGARVTVLEGSVATLTSQMAGALASIATLQSQYNALTGRMNAAESTIATHTTQIAANSTQIGTNSNDIVTLENEMSALQAQVGAIVLNGALTNPGSAGRLAGTTYTNNSGGILYVSGSCNTSGGSTGALTCYVNGVAVYRNDATATMNGGSLGFQMMVPLGATYKLMLNELAGVPGAGSAVTGVKEWTELVITI